MPERLQLARNWLPRYTGMALDRFGDYILLTNFRYHVDTFAETFGCELIGEDKPMQAATNPPVPIICETTSLVRLV